MVTYQTHQVIDKKKTWEITRKRFDVIDVTPEKGNGKD